MLQPQIFKSNDIRGIVTGPDLEWDLAGASALGSAYVALSDLAGKTFVIGRDMRQLGEELSSAFVDAARRAGANVVDIGLSSTDELWFASGELGIPGVQFTASHNPSEYNGIKFCLAHAAPVAADFTALLRSRAEQAPVEADQAGSYRTWDALSAYAKFIRDQAGATPGRRRLRVVVDAGNGMAGHTAGPVLEPLDLEVIGLFLEPDGTFPNHPPNPLVPENLLDAQAAVRESGADLGLVFDGDADRCFIIDELGEVVDPSSITAMIAERAVEREPGATIVINTITSRAVDQVVREAGGQTVISRVGHTAVKALMAEHSAAFGGEHSAHYYFREFWGADSGMLAAMHVLAMLADGDRPLSELVRRFGRYARSGELNSVVQDAAAVTKAVEAAFEGRGTVDASDGLTIAAPTPELNWWFNLRSSNTEPLLRLNVEATDEATMIEIRNQVQAIIKENA